MAVLAALTVIACSLLLGSMVFFAAVVAPSVFRFLPQDMAALYLRGVFPRYYLWGAILAGIAAALALPGSPAAGAVLIAVAAAFVAVRHVLVPRINEARDGRAAGDEAARRRFASLHRISVIINLTQMLVLAGVIALLTG